MPISYPAPIRTDGSNAFAHRSMAERVPRIFQEVRDRNPDYPAPVHERIEDLRQAIMNDAPLALFDPPAPDYDTWAARYARHDGESWLDTEWLFAEMFAYRHLMDACQYWTTRRDPFRPVKDDEITSEALRATMEEALARTGPLRERLPHAFLGALWGNRMDLSMSGVAEQGTDAADEHLLVNDAPRAAVDLLQGEPGTIHLIMDNAGTEEAFDLALADLLLSEEVARHVVLHVKRMPVLVSDVLGEDIFWLLDVMDGHGGRLAQLAERIRGHIRAGRLRIVPDRFWNTDGRMGALPPRLHKAFEDAALVVAKGDANYRRATNDAIWPPEASWADAVAAVPAPFLALRTVKSDTLVGVDPATVQRLDATQADWRTTGTYGVAQYAAPAPDRGTNGG
jgi:hypothetical protein